MAVPFSAEAIDLHDVYLRSGAVDPIAGAGVAAPVGSHYYGTSGRQWIKQAAADTAWRSSMIRGPYFNVLDYGAVGDDVTDNLVAINAAITAASAAGGGVVFFPPGRYAVYKTGAGANQSFDLNGSAYNNITFLGCGASSVVHMVGNGYSSDWYLFYVRATCKYVTFKNLAFSGVGVTNPDPAEQMHAIQISNLLTDNAYTGHVRVLDCRFFRFVGDGVRVLGNGDTRQVRDVLIKRCAFTMRDPGSGLGSRSGVAYQRGTYGVDVIDCYFTGSDDQDIDMESTSTVSMGQHALVGNHIEHDASGAPSLTLTGTGSGHHLRSVVVLNTVRHGLVQGLNVQQMTFAHNIIELTGYPADAQDALSLQERIKGNVIADNQIYVEDDMVTGNKCIGLTEGSGSDNHGTLVAGNLMVRLGAAGSIISSETQNEISINNNYGRVTAGTAPDNIVSVRTVGVVGRAIQASGCLLRATTTLAQRGFVLSASSSNMGSSLVTDCLVNGITVAGVIYSTGGGGVHTGPVIAARVLATPNGSSPPVDFGSPQWPVDGNGGTFPQGLYQGTASPQSLATAMPGSLMGRITGSGDGLSMYIKDDGAVDASGWANIGPAEFVFGALDLTTATGSLYLAPGIALAAASATQFTIVAARDMIVRAIRVKQVAGTGGGNTEYRMMKNGSTTANQVTVAFTATTGNANVSISYAAGDRISVRTSKSVAAATAPTYVVVTLEYYFRS